MPIVSCPKCRSRYDPGVDEELKGIDPSQMSLKVVCPACGQWLRLPENEPIEAPRVPKEVLEEMKGQSRLIEKGETRNGARRAGEAFRAASKAAQEQPMSAITFSCHACNRSMRVGADKAGRKAKCPQCGTVLTIPEPPLEELEAVEEIQAGEPPQRDDRRDRDEGRRRGRYDDFDDRDEPRGRRRDRDDDRDDYDDRRSRPSKGKTDWGRVHLGMKLCWYGALVLLIAYGVNLLGSLFLTFESLRDNPNLFDVAFGGFSALFTIGSIIARLAYLGMFAGLVLAIVGEVFWFWTQNKHGTLGFAIASVSVGSFAALWLLGQQMTFFTPMTFLGSGLSVAIWVVGVQFILAALFFRGFGRLVDDEAAEAQAKMLLIFGSIVAGYQVISQIIGIAIYNPFTFVLNFGAGPSFGARLTLALIYWFGTVPTGIMLFLHMRICKRGIELSR